MEVLRLKTVNRISVVGAGLMGHGIAQTFAQRGYQVRLYDVSRDLVEQAITRIESNLQTFVEAGLETRERLEQIVAHLEGTTELDRAVAEADFVVEAAPEDFDLKKGLFRDLDKFSPDHCILASNTSMLPISAFGSEVSKRDKLIITHWFNPPHIVPVVEVVLANETSEETFQITFRLLREIGKQPVKVLKEIPGFLVNRIQTAMFREVLALLEQGVASAEDIDRAIKGSFGFRLGAIGVLETMDLAGLDLMYKGTKYLYRFIESSQEPQEVLKEKVDKGHLGVKTGKGFYSYESGNEPSNKAGTVAKRDRKLLELTKVLSAQ